MSTTLHEDLVREPVDATPSASAHAPTPVVAIDPQQRQMATIRALDESDRRRGRAVDTDTARQQQRTWWKPSDHPIMNWDDVIVATTIGGPVVLPTTEPSVFTNYTWIDNFTNAELADVYRTDAENYVASSTVNTITAWVSGHQHIRVGLRHTSSGTLVAAVIGRVVSLVVGGVPHDTLEIGWLYVGEQHRRRGMTARVMTELRRRAVCELQMHTGIFTSTCMVAPPVSTTAPCVRELHTERLIGIMPNETGASYDERLRASELRSELMATGLRRMQPDDAPAVVDCLNSIDTYDVWRRWTVQQVVGLATHLTSWVVEDPDTHRITDVVCLAEHNWHPRTSGSSLTTTDAPIRVAHIVLQAFMGESRHPITRIITDIMIHCERAGYDLVQSDMIGDTDLYAPVLRFVPMGYPRITTTYNFSCAPTVEKQIGTIIGGWNI